MIAPFPYPSTGERTRRVQAAPAPGQVDRVQHQPSAEPVTRSASEPLRCLWYHAGLADTLAVVEEFLRTPAAIAALADFCRARPGGPAGPLEARTLAGAVALIAARMGS